ncbi:hemerythrin domain-containing protein [Planosporangium flavigriseum]|uniref:Hemerythrin n=1 Tax=Planosporangium flavigriseum TaxID=373681 RepID=A0A8J3LJ30_9ACTN|nr:hemerythrin domain-containing protein [Planosporangium flavigriseum]NJC66410.1 hemerythrin domain-containing protein [Planosporangium flavigriseum]GIG74183.1 hemerythrin [Planosporangium flavigriseum]
MSAPQDRGEDLVDVLIHDHREIEELFGELQTGDPGAEERRRIADEVVAELVRHSVVEEQYLYPTLRRVLPEGDRIADHEIQDHSEAEVDMKRLERLEATDPDFEFVLSRLMAAMRQHFLEEEVEVFPRLRMATDPDELRELADRAQQAKKFAPTRPHPAVPANQPVSRLLYPALGLVDRIRDALRRA